MDSPPPPPRMALPANTCRLLCERKRKEAAPIEGEEEENPCPATETEMKPPPSGSPICPKISESRICRNYFGLSVASREFTWPRTRSRTNQRDSLSSTSTNGRTPPKRLRVFLVTDTIT